MNRHYPEGRVIRVPFFPGTCYLVPEKELDRINAIDGIQEPIQPILFILSAPLFSSAFSTKDSMSAANEAVRDIRQSACDSLEPVEGRHPPSPLEFQCNGDLVG